MAGKVVGRKLILRIEALGAQKFRPFEQKRPVILCEISVSVHLSKTGDHQQHVATFLNRHLIFFSFLRSTILLPIRKRIAAKIVRGERKLPARQASVVENRFELCFQKARIEKQKEGCARIGDVYSVNRAVTEVFLREVKRTPVEV